MPSYQWQRSAGGAPFANIAGATFPSYVMSDPLDASSDFDVLIDGAASQIYTSHPPVPDPGPFSPGRYVWAFGDPNWAYNLSLSGTNTPGWAFNWPNWNGSTSSCGWARDSEGSDTITPQRIYYDDSAFPNLMSGITGAYGNVGLGSTKSGPCKTVACRIDGSDRSVPGITNTAHGSVLRLPHPDDENPDYGTRPMAHPQQGETWWYGWAFATNPGYRPHGWDGSDLAWGDYNAMGLEMHGSDGYSLLGPLLPNISTIWPANSAERIAGPNGSVWWKRFGNASSFIGQPRLGFDLTAGDRAVGTTDNSTNTCRGFVGPVLVTGQRYKVIFRVVWDAFQNGAVQWYVDTGDGRGYVLYADQTGVSTLWRNGSTADPFVYPQMLNYRKYDTSLASNIFYYAGYIRGTTMADVSIP